MELGLYDRVTQGLDDGRTEVGVRCIDVSRKHGQPTILTSQRVAARRLRFHHVWTTELAQLSIVKGFGSSSLSPPRFLIASQNRTGVTHSKAKRRRLIKVPSACFSKTTYWQERLAYRSKEDLQRSSLGPQRMRQCFGERLAGPASHLLQTLP